MEGWIDADAAMLGRDQQRVLNPRALVNGKWQILEIDEFLTMENRVRKPVGAGRRP
ncbi:MAG TPA: hypothetical protein VMP13_00845 [Acidimicrobiia bacterium]|nr:hypothetical protein [Acidimicrobiia bacterium]